MQLRFPTSETVPLFHSRELPSVPLTVFFRVIALDTTFIPTGHEIDVLVAPITRRFPAETEVVFEPSPTFCEKYQLLAFSSLCESGETLPAPFTIPCYFCQCVQAQILFDSQLSAGQPVPASINFLHTALLRQHYPNHFPESPKWSFMQIPTPVSAQGRQHFSLSAAAWIVHLQLLTLNQRPAPVLPTRRSSAAIVIPTSRTPVRTASTSSSVRVKTSPSRSLNRAWCPRPLILNHSPVTSSPVHRLPFTPTCSQFRKTQTHLFSSRFTLLIVFS